jgi:GH15 family glucan-1,4-alpha-glucosidase
MTINGGRDAGSAGPGCLIGEHGLIGDLRTSALVAADGTVDSLCLPDADSPSIFAAALDRERGGHFAVALTGLPAGELIRHRQLYLPNTNILITRLQAAGAVTEVADYMLPVHLAQGREGVFVRRVTPFHGSRTVRLACWPGFDYARAAHHAALSGDGRSVVFRAGDAGTLRLHCSHDLRLVEHERGAEAVAEVTLSAGEAATVVLDWVKRDSGGPAEPAGDVLGEVDAWTSATAEFWHRWIDGSTYQGHWPDPVRRSALCLKLLQHQPTGGIVAAPTFGLPEWPGEQRNWDYRYVWLRDASFVIFALLRIGLADEAAQFADWLSHRCDDIRTGSGLHPVYRLDGTPPQAEEQLNHLAGYAGSTPIRIGNAAYGQVQLDILGEVLDALYLFDRVRPISWDLWEALTVQLDWLAGHWREPDAGMWEIRGPRQQFVSSKLLVWVAFERAGRLARRRGLPGARDKWQQQADAAYRWVQQNGWNPAVSAYVQREGSADLDASALLIPMLRFASGTDPRVLATLDRVRDHLSTDSLLYRYHSPAEGASGRGGRPASNIDGVGGLEGTFTVCSFWYAENLARAGRADEARLTFEKTLTYANEVGLFSEQIGPAGEALGNFPQALTHLALISAATTLDRQLHRDGKPP